MTWVVRDGKLVLWKYNRPQLWASEIILHFERQDWHQGIPEIDPISFNFRKPHVAHQPGSVPIFRVGDFKGLESDAILLHLQGPAPINREEIYIGISRARMLLAILVDKRVVNSLPLPIRLLLNNEPLRRSWKPS